MRERRMNRTIEERNNNMPTFNQNNPYFNDQSNMNKPYNLSYNNNAPYMN